jgi:alpha-D-xyloside xylohydrolase
MSTAELLAVKDSYRNGNIPVDVIVQDWQYWDPFVWGSHLDGSGSLSGSGGARPPDARRHVHSMISILASVSNDEHTPA